jgi:hypothetical protein
MTVDWNPDDKSSRLSLINSDRTAIWASTYYDTWAMVRATATVEAPGKYYWELTWDYYEPWPSTYCCVGTSHIDVGTNGYPGYYYNVYGVCGWRNDGQVYAKPGYYTTVGFSLADRLMIAIDCAAGKVWFGKNGTWINSGDPANGLNQSGLTLPGTPVWPALGLYGKNGRATVYFEAGQWAYAPPAGFGAVTDGVTITEYDIPEEVFRLVDSRPAVHWEWPVANEVGVRYAGVITNPVSGEYSLDLSSAQVRRSAGKDSYLSCTIKLSAENIPQIAKRASNGEIGVRKIYTSITGEQAREDLLFVPIKSVRLDEGARNWSATLYGYAEEEFSAKSHQLIPSRIDRQHNGETRYAVPWIESSLEPGDMVALLDDSITVGAVEMLITPDRYEMQLTDTGGA